MSRARAARVIDWVSTMVVLWLVLGLVPASWFGYIPKQVVVTNGSADTVPVVNLERTIWRDVRQKYTVVVRELTTLRAVCDPQSGVFTYKRQPNGVISGDIVWWSGGDDRCWPLDPGEYIMETCWTVTRPFYGLVWPKSQCLTSNPFTISEVRK